MAFTIEKISENPLSVAKKLTELMTGNHDDELLSKDEVEELESILSSKPDRSVRRGKKREFVPRGEGGSGERKVPTVPVATDSEGDGDSDAGDHVSEPDGNQQTDELISSHAGHQRNDSSQSSEPEFTNKDLLSYMEECFRSLASEMAVIRQRLEIAEQRIAVKAPLDRLGPSSPPRHSNRNSLTSTMMTKRTPQASSKLPLRDLFRTWPDYPSIKGVRRTRIKRMAEVMNVTYTDQDATPSEWNIDSMYTLLCGAPKE